MTIQLTRSNAVLEAIVPGRTQLPPRHGVKYLAFVDMSGGSSDDATCAVAHAEGGKVIVDLGLMA